MLNLYRNYICAFSYISRVSHPVLQQIRAIGQPVPATTPLKKDLVASCDNLKLALVLSQKNRSSVLCPILISLLGPCLVHFKWEIDNIKCKYSVRVLLFIFSTAWENWRLPYLPPHYCGWYLWKIVLPLETTKSNWPTH